MPNTNGTYEGNSIFPVLLMTKVKLLIGSLDIMDQNCKKVPECLYYCPDSQIAKQN